MAKPATRLARNLEGPRSYEIHIKERIDPRWAELFEGMTISWAENGESILSGPVMDKSALHGMLALIGEMNLTLISFARLTSPKPLTGGNHEE